MRILSDAMQSSHRTATSVVPPVHQQTASPPRRPTPAAQPVPASAPPPRDTTEISAVNSPPPTPVVVNPPVTPPSHAASTVAGDRPHRSVSSTEAHPSQPTKEATGSQLQFDPAVLTLNTPSQMALSRQMPRSPNFARQLLDAMKAGKLTATSATLLKQGQAISDDDGPARKSVSPIKASDFERMVLDQAAPASQLKSGSAPGSAAPPVLPTRAVQPNVPPRALASAPEAPSARTALPQTPVPPSAGRTRPSLSRDNSSILATIQRAAQSEFEHNALAAGSLPEHLNQPASAVHNSRLPPPPPHRAVTGLVPQKTAGQPLLSQQPYLNQVAGITAGLPREAMRIVFSLCQPRDREHVFSPALAPIIFKHIQDTINRMEQDLQTQLSCQRQGLPHGNIPTMTKDLDRTKAWLAAKVRGIALPSSSPPNPLPIQQTQQTSPQRPQVTDSLLPTGRWQSSPRPSSSSTVPTQTLMTRTFSPPGTIDFSSTEAAWSASLDGVGGNMQAAW